MVEVFREKEATSPEKALTWKELGFPAEFENLSLPIPENESPIVRTGRKYYLSEERLVELRKRRNEIFSPLRKWIKHTAKVPKGFLRYQVLHKLKECSMSGAELSKAIANDMDGFWKPKPGSIYPLLRSLLRDGLTREIPDKDGRTRRYELTKKGIEFLETEIDRSRELREKISQGVFPFSSFGSVFGSSEKIPESLQTLFTALLNFRMVLLNSPSPEILDELTHAAKQFTSELERIRKKFEDSQ